MEDLVEEKIVGYKNSVLGFIPQDWEIKSIKEIVDKKVKWSFTGGPFGSNLKADDYTDKGVRIIQLQNIGDGNFLNKYKIYTTIKKADELLSCNIYPGEIILSKMGDPVARACFIPDIADRFVMSSDGIRLVPDNNIANKFFILNYINNSVFRSEALKVSIGSTRRRIGLDDLRDLKIPLPSLKEQKAIADCLSTWDKSIEKLNQLIAQKELRKKGLMQELLTGKKRLRGFDGVWEEFKLEYFIDEYKEKPGKDCNYEILTSSKTGLMRQTEYYGNNRITNREDVDYNIIPPNYLTYRSRSDDGLFTINKNDLNIMGLISGYYPVFKIKNGNLDFMLLYCNFYKEKLMKYSIGTSQLVLSINALKSANFKLPSLEEQNSIALILLSIDKEIQLLKNKLEQLKMQKKGLMQVLLTGKKRLKY